MEFPGYGSQVARLTAEQLPKRCGGGRGCRSLVLVVGLDLDTLEAEEEEDEGFPAVSVPIEARVDPGDTVGRRLDLHIGHGPLRLLLGVVDVDGVGKDGLMGASGSSLPGGKVPDRRLDPPCAVDAVEGIKARPVDGTEVRIGDVIGSRKYGYLTLARVVRVGKRKIRGRE